VRRAWAANRPWLALCCITALALSLPAANVCAEPGAAMTRSAVVAPELPARAEQPRAPDRTRTSGLGIGAGLGSDNVFFGGHVVYYAQLPNPKLRVALHIGAGVSPWVDETVAWGVRGGSFVSYGRRHRLVLGVLGGTLDWLTFVLHSQTLASKQVFGVGVGLGYEFMTEAGFYLRATVGPALEIFPEVPLRDREVALVWRGNLLTMGYKLW
jgi:hypothetical protein